MKKLYNFIVRLSGLNILVCLCTLIILNTEANAQNVAITDNDAYTANGSAMLDVMSTTKGMLIPRLTTAQRTTLTATAVEGLMVYDTNFNSFFYFSNGVWTIIPKVTSSVGVGVALFAIVNATGDTIFAVYNDGVKITVPEGTKGNVGGFAVSGRTPTKAGTEISYFRVTSDSTRIYINDTAAIKGNVGGFAISGRTPTKVGEFDYLRVTPDSTRIYVNEGFNKGTVGGFAISGRTPTKAKLNSYFLSTMDSTRIYVSDTITKGTVGGFAISGRTPTKGDPLKFMDMTKNNYLIGQEAGMNITTGKYNAYMGYQAGKFTKSGSKNIFLGFQAGLKTDNANENIFIGYQAGNQNLGGNWNTFLGTEAGFTNTGSDNTFIGYQSGKMHQNQGGNVYIGSRAGRDATNGQQNVYIGESTGLNTTFGKSNVFIGYQSGMNNTGDAGNSNIGSYNVYLGYQAGLMGDKVFRNVFLGYQAGMNTIVGAGDPKEGSVNVFIGSEAGLSNTIGFANTAIGEQALKSNTTGKGNVALGRMPLMNNIDGEYNVSIGNQSLFNNKSGNENVALGAGALWNNDSGDWNLAIGNLSLNKNQTGSGNVALGSSALYSLVSGNKNVAIGSAALTLSLDSANVAVGAFALAFLNRGVKNTAIGNGANVQSIGVEYNNSTAIGYTATITASNQVVIGNTDVTNVTIPGVYNGTTTFQPNLYVNSLGQIMRSTTALSGSGAANKLAYWTGTGSLSYNTNLHWDNTSTRLGIGTLSPSYTLDVAGPVNIAKDMSGGVIALRVNNVEALWSDGSQFSWGFGGTYNYFADKVGIGTTGTIAGALNIAGSAPVMHIKHNSISGGQAIRFENNLGVMGNIYITTTGVNYTGFTGSHFATVEDKTELGILISFTGENTYTNKKEDSEIIYGGKVNVEPNSKSILGSYLENIDFNESKKCDLIMAVGNGVVWVADNGDNIEIGDYLVSSSVPGHAMKDKREYEISNIVGRAAESIDWSKETQLINGVKHKLISVFFENFKIERDNDNIEYINNLKAENEKLKKEITHIKIEHETFKTELENIKKMITK